MSHAQSGNGVVLVPRWLVGAVLASLLTGVVGGAAWVTRAEGRMARIEEANFYLRDSLQRIEQKLDRLVSERRDP